VESIDLISIRFKQFERHPVLRWHLKKLLISLAKSQVERAASRWQGNVFANKLGW